MNHRASAKIPRAVVITSLIAAILVTMSPEGTKQIVWMGWTKDQEHQMSRPIMVVNFSVPQDMAPEFTDFYHHEFLPHIFKHSPEIYNIRRYEEFGVGASLRWYNKQYL